MLLLVWDADRFSQFWAVRFGIYTGLILTVQFSMQVALSSELAIGFVLGVVSIVPLLIGYVISRDGIHYLWRNWAEQWVKITTGVIVLLLPVGLYFGGATLIIAILCAAVLACPVIAIVTSYRLWVHIERESAQIMFVKLLSFLGWGGAWGTAGFIAINRVLDLYSQLPDTPPDCYVATASANGHPALVGGQTITLADGRKVMISRQLQILKVGELVLRHVAPKFHRGIRIVYDWAGPKLAQRVRSPWVADIGYLFFKPFEWLTMLILNLWLPEQAGKVDQIYLGRPNLD